MKTRECIERLRTSRRIRIAALAVVAFIVFSYLHSRGISGMDGGRHRLFQGIFQVHLQDCLLPAGCGDTILHPQLSGLLTIPGYETYIPYRFL